MVETRSGRRFAVVFLVAAFLILLLGRWIEPLDRAALMVAAPFASAVTVITTGVGDTISGVFEGPHLRAENESLKRKMALLLRRNLALQEQQHENQLLRHMLNFKDANSSLRLFGARIISSDPNTLGDSVLINRGTRDGLHLGMTVLDDSGYFLGRISDLTVNAAKVLLVVSPSSSVGAVDLQTHALGLVEGQFASRPRFRWVATSARMRVGDFIVTSGQYNLFPRNVLIGQVVSIRHRNVDVFQEAVIRPAVDFGDLEMTQVVRNFIPNKPTRLINQ